MKPKNIQSVIRFTLLTCFFAALLLLPAALFAQTANAMLAFTSGGHALGFRADAMFAASRDHALRVEFVNANAVSPQANDAVARNDSTRGAPGLTRVTYPNLWNGVTLAYDAPAGEIARSTYTLAPFADPAQIRLRYNAPLAVNADGELSIAFETGAMRETAPIAWQDIGGARVPVQIAFRVVGAREVGFAVGDYDRAYSLQIDPTLTWNTFLGSSGYDKGYSVAVDANGNVYVAGYSTATWGSPVRAFSSGGDAFAAKLDSSGALTWNTFLGGSGSDYGNSVAVDANGNVYVAGYSDATWGSPMRAFSSGADAFAAKLDSSGALAWNTFLGGSEGDYGNSVAVDANGNVYVAGYSYATWGSPARAFSGSDDAFAAKLDFGGVLTWNTFLGGGGFDVGYSVAVDANENVYVAGYSAATWGSPVRAFSGYDAFAAKLDANGNLAWNTFLGSSGSDDGNSVAVDANGNVYVAGNSDATWGSPVRAFSGYDAFAAKLTSSGALAWNTFLGGSEGDYGNSVAVDANGNVYVAGYSYVTWGSPARAFSGFNDAFAAKLDFSGVLTWNTFLGGGGNDIGYSVAVDANGNVYVAGGSDATWGSPVRAFSSYNDAFVVKLGSACALKPAKPTLGLPAKNGSVTKPKVKLKWNDVSCETEYRVTVKNVATNQTVFQSTLGADVTQVKTTKLAKGQTYKWFVQACNDIGCTKSATWKFFIKP